LNLFLQVNVDEFSLDLQLSLASADISY